MFRLLLFLLRLALVLLQTFQRTVHMLNLTLEFRDTSLFIVLLLGFLRLIASVVMKWRKALPFLVEYGFEGASSFVHRCVDGIEGVTVLHHELEVGVEFVGR